ncbi:Kinesin-like protein KIN-7O [Sarracenia purpurea var. burkii]
MATRVTVVRVLADRFLLKMLKGQDPVTAITLAAALCFCCCLKLCLWLFSIIESRERSEDENADSYCDAVRVSVLNLVDLAGSERAAKTGAEGVRLKEGSHINKSLMTLGTVIKKLSEGAESQGGHVPYRDSKLTRILQPALGGNANTAIICNITLAQIHADETRSSLQFASRALRVTNCARVNEILTDAALLKRQKKEIEELKAKLQGSHSEHFEEEILSLRNTLLQTELERERIALELEEEKKAQAEREKRLQEQAKRIENLSSMVLYSNRDDMRDQPKKVYIMMTTLFSLKLVIFLLLLVPCN